jgi:hypothetical protein
MIMRVAVGIHGSDIDRVLETYNLMSERYFTHASPTLFNAGTPHPQLSSCFLICMKEDSIEGIYDTLKNCAMISKTAGGIGLSIHCIRATGYAFPENFLSSQAERIADHTSRALTGIRMGLFLCCVLLMPLHATLIKAETNDLVPLRSTLNPGTQIFLSSLTLGRIMVKKRPELAICSMLCGSLIFCSFHYLFEVDTY